MYLFYHSLVQTIGSVVYCKNVNKIDVLSENSNVYSTLDSHQLLVKSTLSPQLKQVLTFGEKDIKRQWDY